MTGHFVAVHLRHHDVKNHEIHALFADVSECLCSAMRCDYFEAFATQRVADQAKSVGIVVYYQYSLCHPIALTSLVVEAFPDEALPGYAIRATARTSG